MAVADSISVISVADSVDAFCGSVRSYSAVDCTGGATAEQVEQPAAAGPAGPPAQGLPLWAQVAPNLHNDLLNLLLGGDFDVFLHTAPLLTVDDIVELLSVAPETLELFEAWLAE